MEKTKPIGAELKALNNLIKRRLDGVPFHTLPHRPTGVQGMIIGFMANHSRDDIFQRDIENEFNIRRSTATGILKLMEQKGLITKESVPYDERLKKLRLTDEALALHQQFMEHLKSMEAALAEGLTDDDIRHFFRITDIMKRNLSP